MATRKSVNAQIEESKEAPVLPAEEKPDDIWEEMVEIYVPRRPRGEEQRYWICVNGRSVLIPANGEKQLMRRPFAEVLENRLKAEAEADRVLDGIEAHDPMSNPYK